MTSMAINVIVASAQSMSLTHRDPHRSVGRDGWPRTSLPNSQRGVKRPASALRGVMRRHAATAICVDGRGLGTDVIMVLCHQMDFCLFVPRVRPRTRARRAQPFLL